MNTTPSTLSRVLCGILALIGLPGIFNAVLFGTMVPLGAVGGIIHNATVISFVLCFVLLVSAAVYAFLVWQGVRLGSFLYAGGAAALGIVVAVFVITMYVKAPTVLCMDFLTT